MVKDVEVLRNAADVVVLENGEVRFRNAGTDQHIAAGIAAEVEAEREGHGNASVTGRRLVTVGLPKGQVGSGWNCETLGLDVVGGISRIGEGLATGSSQPIEIGRAHV